MPGTREIILNDSVNNDTEALEKKVKMLEERVVKLENSLSILGINNDINPDDDPVQGEFIGVVNEKLVGWVYNRMNPHEALSVTAYYQNKPITTMLAQEILNELDVPQEAYGRGFRIILPEQFYDGKERTIRLKVDKLDYELPFSPTKVTLGNYYPINGQFEGSNEGYLVGWVIDNSEPFNSMEVAVYYNQRLVCKSIADLKRDDLEKELGSNVHHGFKIKLPNQYYDGKNRRFRIQVYPWGVELGNSPQTISFME